jgi:hypothetical protein
VVGVEEGAEDDRVEVDGFDEVGEESTLDADNIPASQFV